MPVEGDLSASDFVELVRSGQPVDLDGVTIEGDIDLRGIGEVAQPIRCTDCTFTGSVRLADVVFTRIVDLSGAQVAGGIHAQRSAFDDSFLLGSTPSTASTVAGSSSFALVRFEAEAVFDGAGFTGPVDFGGAKFRADASFVGTEFGSEAGFARATFAENAVFTGTVRADGEVPGVAASSKCPTGVAGSVSGAANFARTKFGAKADFRQRCFAGPADFSSAAFGHTTEFAQATFLEAATFERASFAGPASYRLVRFHSDVTLNRVVGESLDFEAATFMQDAVLFGLTLSGALSLADIEVAEAGAMDLQQLRAGMVTMDVATALRLPGTRTRTRLLAMIEESARAREDLSVANDAHYEREVLEGDQKVGLEGVVDRANRTFAGYLVRPLNPLLAIAALVAVATVVRGVSWSTRASTRTRRAVAWAKALAQTVGVAVKPTPPDDIKVDPDAARSVVVASVRWGEYLVFKVLTLVFLLGLGNANPTFKELIEAVLE